MPLDRDPAFEHPPLLENVSQGIWPIRECVESPADALAVVHVQVENEVTTDTNNDKNSEIKRQAEKFFDKVQSGIPPGRAANIMHTSLKRIHSSEEMTRVITELTNTANLNAEIRKKMVRAGLNKIFMENVDSDDIKRQKLALDTAKQIAADPEIQLGQDGPTVEINVSEFGSALKGITLPGLEPFVVTKEEEGINGK